jgi:hypothetical protein
MASAVQTLSQAEPAIGVPGKGTLLYSGSTKGFVFWLFMDDMEQYWTQLRISTKDYAALGYVPAFACIASLQAAMPQGTPAGGALR